MGVPRQTNHTHILIKVDQEDQPEKNEIVRHKMCECVLDIMTAGFSLIQQYCKSVLLHNLEDIDTTRREIQCTCTCTYIINTMLLVQCILYIMDTLVTGKLLCYTEVSFMWRLFYTVRNVIGTLGAVC